MAEIKLKAKLRAYQKEPFYNDYVRDVYNQEPVNPDWQYVRRFKQKVDDLGNSIPGEYEGEWATLDEVAFGNTADELNEKLKQIGKDIDRISLENDFENPTRLIFTDGNGAISNIDLPTSRVDYKTINMDDNYTLYAVNKPDETTIRLRDINEEVSNTDDETDEYNIINRKSALLEVVGIQIGTVDSEGNIPVSQILTGEELNRRLLNNEKNIRDLEAYVQGKGGYLDPAAFGSLYLLNPEDEGYEIEKAQNRDITLNSYAYRFLNLDPYNDKIPDQTKVQNTDDGIIWIYHQEVNTWYNDGTDVVVQANNKGVLGVITGSLDGKYKCKVEEDGTLSVNGVEEEFTKVVYEEDTSVEPNNDTYAKRDENGRLKATDAVEDNDTVNLGQFNNLIAEWQEDMEITDEEILKMVKENYLPEIEL